MAVVAGEVREEGLVARVVETAVAETAVRVGTEERAAVDMQRSRRQRESNQTRPTPSTAELETGSAHWPLPRPQLRWRRRRPAPHRSRWARGLLDSRRSNCSGSRTDKYPAWRVRSGCQIGVSGLYSTAYVRDIR